MTPEKTRWYVYELIDPRTEKPFYVGKGTRSRINDHEREALQGVCSKKCNKIRQITLSGLQIIKQKMAIFWDEQAAYDHETDRIEMYGLENLTNIHPGGQVAWERRVFERDERKKEFTPDIALKAIQRSPSNFAYWLREIKAKKIGEVKVKTGFGYVYDCLYEVFLNVMAEKAWEKAKEEPKNLPVLKSLFAPYKIDLVFDGV
jgi:hypothetical protein